MIITSWLKILQCLRVMTVISCFLLSPLTTENKGLTSTRASRWGTDDAGWQSANGPPLHVYLPIYTVEVSRIQFIMSCSSLEICFHHVCIIFLWKKCSLTSYLIVFPLTTASTKMYSPFSPRSWKAVFLHSKAKHSSAHGVNNTGQS